MLYKLETADLFRPFPDFMGPLRMAHQEGKTIYCLSACNGSDPVIAGAVSFSRALILTPIIVTAHEPRVAGKVRAREIDLCARP